MKEIRSSGLVMEEQFEGIAYRNAQFVLRYEYCRMGSACAVRGYVNIKSSCNCYEAAIWIFKVSYAMIIWEMAI